MKKHRGFKLVGMMEIVSQTHDLFVLEGSKHSRVEMRLQK